MAGLVLFLDTSAMEDAIDEMLAIHGRLARCHGAAYRRLERAIEALCDDMNDDDKPALVETHWLGGGRIMAAPGERVTEILLEARRLGVA